MHVLMNSLHVQLYWQSPLLHYLIENRGKCHAHFIYLIVVGVERRFGLRWFTSNAGAPTGFRAGNPHGTR